MSFRLNKEKSILKERIIYKLNWEFFFELLFEIFIYIGLTILTVVLLSNSKNNVNIFFVLGIVSFIFLILFSWYLNYKLVKIKVKNLEGDRKILVEMLTEKFPEFNLNDNGLNVLRCKYRGGLFSNGKKLLVIYADNKILLNIQTYGKGELNLPIYSIINYIKLLRINDAFQKRKKR